MHPHAEVSTASPITLHTRITWALAAAALAGVTYYVLTVIALHVLRSDQDPIQRAVSDYAVGRLGGLFTAAFVIRSAGVACLAVALIRTLGAARSRSGVTLLAIYAACGVLIAIFPTDLPGARLTRAGALHVVFSLISFLAVTIAAFVLARAFGRDARWRSFQPVAYALALVVLAGLIVQLLVLVVPAFKSDFGLAERVFILAVVAWLAAVALRVFALVRRGHPSPAPSV